MTIIPCPDCIAPNMCRMAGKCANAIPTREDCLAWLNKRTVQYTDDNEELLLMPAGESHIKSRDILNEIISMLTKSRDAALPLGANGKASKVRHGNPPPARDTQTTTQDAELVITRDRLINSAREAHRWLGELQLQLREKDERIAYLEKQVANAKN